jgi:hypothetical protein
MTARMCQACYEGWRCAGKPQRDEWVPTRRQSLKGPEQVADDRDLTGVDSE